MDNKKQIDAISLPPEVERDLKESFKAVEEGDYKEFETVDELMNYLKSDKDECGESG